MKVVTFGEIMMRLSPEGYSRIVQSEKFVAMYSGAEANVAVSLANFGMNSSFVTKVPDNEIGQSAINQVRRFGVNTDDVVIGGDRLGIYFAEKGASQRSSKVVYDRANSAIALATESDFDWEKIFEGATWFHFTGITPALSENMSKITLIAVKEAKKRGLTVSCDLNFRKKMWTEKEAGRVMKDILKYVDFCFGIGKYEAESMFGITTVLSGIDGVKDIAKKLTEYFGFKGYSLTLRESISASDEKLSAMYYVGGEYYFGSTYQMHIVDRIGGGDAFTSGLIYAIINNYDPQKSVDFALASSVLKHSIEGDFNLSTVAEVSALAEGKANGRVQR